MRVATVTSWTARSVAGGLLAALLLPSGAALAFPFVDPSNRDSLPTTAPTGTELPERDVRGLGNQLRLVNPAVAGNPSAWTIIPRLTVQEMFTDNAYEVASPRRFDAITVIAPGISVAANTARLQLSLDYQPNLILHAVNGPLNSLSQQLTATGLITVIPDLAYVDVRAVSGVQSRYGALGNAGIGNAGSALTPAATGAVGGYGIGGQAGINPRTQVQTSTVGMSPYLLHQFKDIGTGKIGASIDASHSSNINGFFASPFPTGGSNGQSLVTTEQYASFTTGEFFGRVQNAISADFTQSRSTASQGSTVAVFNTLPDGSLVRTNSTVPAQSFNSQRWTINDQVSYVLNRNLTLLASIGEQHVQYSSNVGPRIEGLIWSLGFTYTPSPNSSLTMTYGRNNGANNFQVSGYMAIGGRTRLSVSYSDTVGTQLENLQNQLNNATVNVNGQLVNAVNGGPSFVGTNATGLQAGVYRFDTFNVSATTGWLRDTVQAGFTWTIQTNLTPGSVQSGTFVDPTTGQIFVVNQPIAGTNQSTDIRTGNISWTHELSPDMTLSASASYSMIRRSGNLGTDTSLSTAVGLQYILSASSSVSARYSFFDRKSKIPGYSLYENLLILGLTKQF